MAISKSLTNRLPQEVASTILHRSSCAVKVGACLSDKEGVWEVGWNSAGPSGFGQHAEVSCIVRAMRQGRKDRLASSTLWVAAIRLSSGNVVIARPCIECQEWTRMVGRVVYRDPALWKEL